MSDLSITAANVVKGPTATVEHGTAGETVTAGQIGYRDPTTKKYMKADSNSATAAARAPSCMFLNGAANNQPVTVLTAGPVTLGAILTAGTDYWLSDTAGGICPRADVGSGEYPGLIGVATSTSVLEVHFQASGVAI